MHYKDFNIHYYHCYRSWKKTWFGSTRKRLRGYQAVETVDRQPPVLVGCLNSRWWSCSDWSQVEESCQPCSRHPWTWQGRVSSMPPWATWRCCEKQAMAWTRYNMVHLITVILSLAITNFYGDIIYNIPILYFRISCSSQTWKHYEQHSFHQRRTSIVTSTPDLFTGSLPFFDVEVRSKAHRLFIPGHV